MEIVAKRGFAQIQLVYHLSPFLESLMVTHTLVMDCAWILQHSLHGTALKITQKLQLVQNATVQAISNVHFYICFVIPPLWNNIPPPKGLNGPHPVSFRYALKNWLFS